MPVYFKSWERQGKPWLNRTSSTREWSSRKAAPFTLTITITARMEILGGIFQARPGPLWSLAGRDSVGQFQLGGRRSKFCWPTAPSRRPHAGVQRPRHELMTAGQITLTNDMITNLQLTGGAVHVVPGISRRHDHQPRAQRRFACGHEHPHGSVESDGQLVRAVDRGEQRHAELARHRRILLRLLLLQPGRFDSIARVHSELEQWLQLQSLNHPNECGRESGWPWNELCVYVPLTNAGTFNWNGGYFYLEYNPGYGPPSITCPAPRSIYRAMFPAAVRALLTMPVWSANGSARGPTTWRRSSTIPAWWTFRPAP